MMELMALSEEQEMLVSPLCALREHTAGKHAKNTS